MWYLDDFAERFGEEPLFFTYIHSEGEKPGGRFGGLLKDQQKMVGPEYAYMYSIKWQMLPHGTTSVSYLATLTTPVGPGSQVEKHQEVFPHDICCLFWTLYLVMVDTMRSLFG